MKEIIDIYDKSLNKTGKSIVRHSVTLKPDEYTLGAQAVIINSDDMILISRRSANKSVAPLKWECNGGAILSGEDVLDGLVREIYEELGIILDKNKAIYLKTSLNEQSFKRIYLIRKDIPLADIVYNDGEVCDAKWVSIKEFMDLINNGEMVTNVNFDENDYYKSLELLRSGE